MKKNNKKLSAVIPQIQIKNIQNRLFSLVAKNSSLENFQRLHKIEAGF